MSKPFHVMKAQDEKRSHLSLAMRIRRSSDMIALVALHLAELHHVFRYTHRRSCAGARLSEPVIKNVSRLFSDRYLNGNSLQFSISDHFASGGFVTVKTIPSFTFAWSPLSPAPVSYASSKLN
jgi:hypothetical protein